MAHARNRYCAQSAEIFSTFVSDPETLGQFGINREGVVHGHVRASLMREDLWHRFLGLATPMTVPLGSMHGPSPLSGTLIAYMTRK